MKYLIAGLGNIGNEYDQTRHNIGFQVLDALTGASNIVFEDKRRALLAHLKHKGRTLLLVKPTTYVNLSGKAVSYWLQKEKIPLENLLVITDDLALPFGVIRIRAKGSDGGHNGLKNINETLGTNNYARLRFGIGHNFQLGQQVDFVLGKWNEEEKEQMTERLNQCINAIKDFSVLGVQRIMNLYNNK